MESIKKLYILFFFLATSCNSVLDLDPTAQYSADTFWADEEQYSAALSGVYNSLYNVEIFFDGETDMITPNAISYDDRNGTRAVAKGTALSTNTLFLTAWDNAYTGIGRANTLLDKIDEADFDEDAKNQMKGEALFLRALYYSYLANYFGDCPLILSTPTEEQGTLPRTAKATVIEQVIADLDEAATLLPLSYTGSDISRATNGAALALKARTLLYNGEWEDAAAAAKAVIDSGAYTLFPDYRGLYREENENNEEVIFDIQYETGTATHRFDFVAYTLQRPAPVQDLVDDYLMTDGLSITESSLYDASQPYENRDPRLHQSIAVIGYAYNGDILTADDATVSGYLQKKLTDIPDDETMTITDNSSTLNFIAIRYAEVLLTYAEALNEYNSTPPQEVYDALNQLRQRTTVEMPTIATGLTQAEMREVIRRERRIELAFEGFYYTDIRRWGTIETLNNGGIYGSEGELLEERSFDPDRDYLWAIPLTELQVNTNLEQNPGW